MVARLIEVILLYGIVIIGMPALVVTLALGPSRTWRGVKRAWSWLWRRRLEPEAILQQVVQQYQDLVKALRKTLNRAETAEVDLVRTIQTSEKNIAALEKEAREAASGDDLAARAVLYKLSLERQALQTFQDQLGRQKKQIVDVRKHLYLVELQLRQYEVGRSILLSQLAEAQTAEQQYQIASQFDPFSAVANWQQAEGMVQDKALNARAMERVQSDLAALALPGEGSAVPQVDQAALDAELEELRQKVRRLDTQGH